MEGFRVGETTLHQLLTANLTITCSIMPSINYRVCSIRDVGCRIEESVGGGILPRLTFAL